MSYDVEINRSKVTKSFFWKLSERLMSQGVSLLVQIVLARILLPEDFGSLVIIVAISNYANIFVQSGITTVIVQKKDLDKKDLSTLLTFSLAIAAFFYLLLFLGAPLLANYYNLSILCPSLRVMSLILFFNSFSAVQTGVLTRQMRFKKIFLCTIVAVLVSGIIGIIMALKGWGLWALIAYYLINIVVVVLFMNLDKDLSIPLGFSFAKFKVLFLFTGKVMLTSLVSSGHDLIRTMMIGKHYTSSELAYYDKGYSYSSLVTSVIRQTISSVMLPAFSMRQDNIDGLKSMARRSFRITAFLLVPVLVVVAVMAKPLIVLLLTEKWLPSATFLTIFCFLRIPGPIVSIDNQVYYALGKSEVNLFYEIGLFVFNIIFLLLAVRISVMAIAYGALIVEFIGFCAICIISSKIYGYSLKERLSDLWRPFVNTLVMALSVYAVTAIGLGIGLTIIIQLMIGVFVYIAMASITKDDSLQYCINTLREIIHK